MAEEVISIGGGFLGPYSTLISSLPNWLQTFISLFIIVLVVLIYSIIIWKFYRFISKKNIMGLNLRQYNRAEHPLLKKILAASLYFLEYLIILPFLVFVWFSVFTFFLIILTESQNVQVLLIISTTIIAVIRMAAYYREDLAKDLAKLLPFTLLAISIINPAFFDSSRITLQLSSIPLFFSHIVIYLIFIGLIEIILRFFHFFLTLFGLEIGEREIREEEKRDIIKKEIKV